MDINVIPHHSGVLLETTYNNIFYSKLYRYYSIAKSVRLFKIHVLTEDDKLSYNK